MFSSEYKSLANSCFDGKFNFRYVAQFVYLTCDAVQFWLGFWPYAGEYQTECASVLMVFQQLIGAQEIALQNHWNLFARKDERMMLENGQLTHFSRFQEIDSGHTVQTTQIL